MKASSFLLLLGFFTISYQQIEAYHHHHDTYIIQQPAVIVQPVAPTYVVAQPAAPIVVEEGMGISPGPNFYYVPGGRQWDGCRWHHVHGHWAPRY